MNQDVFTRAELRAAGYSRRRLSSAVASGQLIRARRDRYMHGDAPAALVQAVRVGGRLTCLSLLALFEVFVLENSHLHVHVHHSASRLRSALARTTPLEPRSTRKVRLHWVPLHDPRMARAAESSVSIIDALIHAVRCQPLRAAIATLDSALNKNLIGLAELAEVFAALPQKYRVMRAFIDGRAESGPETLMRLMLLGLGCRIELQVKFAGIGRVDLLVDGWLIIECDSERYHSGWTQQQADRDRDLALAARGYTTLRPTATAIMWRPEEVLAAVRGLLAARADA